MPGRNADGFTMVPNSTARNPSLSDGAVRLYLVLCSHRYKRREHVEVSQASLAATCGWTDRRVRRNLTELHHAGLVRSVQRGRLEVNRYYLTDLFIPDTSVRSDRTPASDVQEVNKTYGSPVRRDLGKVVPLRRKARGTG